MALNNGLTWSMKETQVRPDGERWAFSYSFTLHDVDNADMPDIDRVTVVHPWQGAQTSGSARSYAEKIFMRSLFKVRTGEPDADATSQQPHQQAQAFTRDHWSNERTDVGPQTMPLREHTLDETWQVGDPEAAPLPSREEFSEVVEEYKEGYPVIKAPKPADMAVYPYELATLCFEQFVDLCDDLGELQQFWTDNGKVLQIMKARAQSDFERVKSAFAMQQDKLEKKGKNNAAVR